MTDEAVHVGIELGGTKIVVGASITGTKLVSREVVPTGEASGTLLAVRSAIASVADSYELKALGIASFGPIDLRQGSATYGWMLDTPKAGWSDVAVLSEIIPPDVPFAIDTDVNAALLAERTWGAGTAANVAYLTVGTGIGGAIWSDGVMIHGANHPEIGHVRVPRHPDDPFPGICPFHADCLEGMASGTAISERWGSAAHDLGPRVREALRFESWYLAHAVATIGAVVPVEQVIIGGGVSKMPGLHVSISAMLREASGGYPAIPFSMGGPHIIPPGLGDDAGVVGAIELGRAAISM
jgi:fructokinase